MDALARGAGRGVAARWPRGLLLALLLSLLAPAGARPADDEPSEGIGGHEEAWWRERHDALASAAERLTALVHECEETEAPAAYDGVEGYTVRGRDGRLRWVQVKRCDEERAELAASQAELERFEERARVLGVPPGWLR